MLVVRWWCQIPCCPSVSGAVNISRAPAITFSNPRPTKIWGCLLAKSKEVYVLAAFLGRWAAGGFSLRAMTLAMVTIRFFPKATTWSFPAEAN